MKPFTWIILILLGGAALFWGLPGRSLDKDELPSASLISEFEQPSGFRRAEGPRDWSFPEDFGPHPDYQTEWWYYTGNLQAETGERFGYQLTFFRRALLPAQERSQRDSAWAADQVYMAHFALSNMAGKEHYAFERFTRAAAGLAGAQAAPFQVWLEDWEVVQFENGNFQMQAEQEGIRIDLSLKDIKGTIFHGQQGYSQKGPQDGNASYYFSQTRLETMGAVEVDGKKFPVSGLSWMDHEFSTSALSEDQVGWDWFSIQLDNGAELMIFQIRRADGSIDPFSSGTWISPEGETTHLERDHFELQVSESWRSPHSEGEYPAAWNLHIPTLELEINIQPFLADQEMNVSYAYWEGAVQINATLDGKPLGGSGYVELTGYAASMEGEF
jgi:predicted secreted hydrolase